MCIYVYSHTNKTILINSSLLWCNRKLWRLQEGNNMREDTMLRIVNQSQNGKCCPIVFI